MFKTTVCILIFFVQLNAYAKANPLPKFVGNWSLSKGSYGVCPDKFEITKSGETKLKVKSTRPYSVSENIFDSSKTIHISSSDKIDKNKDKKGLIKKSYNLKSFINTSVANNGTLVSTHLWSSPENDFASTGVKTLSVKNATLTLNKVVTGFMSDESDKKHREDNQKEFFRYGKDYSISASPASCEYSQSKTVKK